LKARVSIAYLLNLEGKAETAVGSGVWGYPIKVMSW
jgi:hypothetical protein